MSRYVVIPRMRVQNANIQTNGLLLGGVPLFAANMFAHHLARQLGIQEEGIIYIHHDQQRLGGQAYGRFTPAQRRGAVFIGKKDYSSKNKYALSLQPTASCHLEFSLVIKFSSSRISPEKLTNILKRSRFAGGQIIEFLDITTHAENELENALKKIKTGFAILDRQDLLIEYQQRKQINRVQAFTQLLALKADALRAFFNDQNLSWISATNLGYALLEPLTDQRAGIRQAQDQETTAHAYAEPLTGIVQYFSLGEILRRNTEAEDDNWHNLQKLLWTYHWPQDDIFLLKQNCINA
ncbi:MULTISPECIES: type I-F CRISPR-associated protein Csy2 [Acinetobacter]|jgi:CRISPR-associated protein Csy2|uniref:Type I-F CRISPR-associated protein Csy2 n=1 Tax=Acinetobacter radioresistens TaxID=40216 RepID=A0A8H2K1P4_ACIRA|nr:MULTISPECIES: type I-F CRISPR-associated protein Csy2 [Acinetobacter]EXB70315.1 CRISPR-associated family protein [Acinetobacter sp. 230853]KCX36894.1 CRISPR-associated family protein [Acinetobacter sp. 263903-1]PSD37517.1 type I-F CRISPR-associated protein Csy2 [Acinetobacter radioresistens]PSD38730.1 type I-F CRISPR-associated protein Csy2 [Acinetobacter radioresistens]QCS12555.1 type I-F CRISPR-associated protein Csy2 [Acinetobacter radioresistens]